MVGNISENLARVRADIEAAARRAGRDPADVTLVAVTKTFPAAVVEEAYRAGARVFGENRVQDALAKQEALAGVFGPGEVSWHFIGTLQKNKARHVVGAFDMIHSIDGVSLAGEVGRRAARLGIVQRCLLEVNIADETTKHGVGPEDAVETAVEIAGIEGIRLSGLMCIPPFTDNPEDSRPHYARLRELLGKLRDAGVDAGELSMGMTQDYEVAVEEGATIVRVGTAIFGERKK